MKQAILLLILVSAFLGLWFQKGKVGNIENVEKETDVFQKSSFEIVAEDLEIPWEIAFMPGGELLITERPGRLVRIGVDRKVYPIKGVLHIGEGGLLGLTLHPNFANNKFVYLYLTTREDGVVTNRVERYRLVTDELIDRTVILSGIPGASIHDGGRIAFGPEGYLYITTGEAGKAQLSQNKSNLGGKILRTRDDSGIPEDNPFGNAVYSWGHRNSQGIAWDKDGRLWATEHGRSGALSGLDELNLIEKGKNYGWPEIQGDETRSGMEKPVIHSGPKDTWAPAGAAYHNGSIFFGGLRGESLYEYQIDRKELKTHFKGKFGRIRAVALDSRGFLYISTSNRDGRGTVREGDDKIIKINPNMLK